MKGEFLKLETARKLANRDKAIRYIKMKIRELETKKPLEELEKMMDEEIIERYKRILNILER